MPATKLLLQPRRPQVLEQDETNGSGHRHWPSRESIRLGAASSGGGARPREARRASRTEAAAFWNTTVLPAIANRTAPREDRKEDVGFQRAARARPNRRIPGRGQETTTSNLRTRPAETDEHAADAHTIPPNGLGDRIAQPIRD